MSTLGKIGKRLIRRFFIVLSVVSLVVCIVTLPLAKITITGSAVLENQIFSIFSMLLDIFPDNIADSFLSGNTMQIIVIAIACGVALLIMDTKAQQVVSIAEKINAMIYIVMEWITTLIPILIFVVVLSNIWSGAVDTIIQIWKPLVTIVVLSQLMIIVYFVGVSFKLKINFLLLMKKIIPAYLIGLTTASSTASFAEMRHSCEAKLGISQNLTKFGIPLGIVAFKPATVINYVVLSLFSASIYGLQISVGWIVMLVIISVILAVATPPVLGGALTAFTMLFLQLSIPAEALLLVMTVDVIVDFFSTGSHVAMIQGELAIQAKKLNLLNADLLHKNI